MPNVEGGDAPRPRQIQHTVDAPLTDDERRAFERVRAAPQEAWRREPLTRKRRYADKHGADLPASAPEEVVDAALERIMDAPDFLPGGWLPIGAKKADTVAKLNLRRRGAATGFMVSPWLLMTNHHVLQTPEQAKDVEVLFRLIQDEKGQVGRRSRTAALDPDSCFITGHGNDLDYTIVAVAPLNGKPPGKTFGWVRVDGDTGKITLGEAVNIIQHPDGRPLEIAVRNNRLLGIDDEQYLTYETDTESGSSGSPVFNDRWTLVALHCGARSAQNEQGVDVDIDGNVVTQTTPESRRKWVANRGVRVSAIVKDLMVRTERDPATSRSTELLAEMLTLGGNA